MDRVVTKYAANLVSGEGSSRWVNIWVNFGSHGAHLPTTEVRTVLGNSLNDCALCALVPGKRVNGVQGVAGSNPAVPTT